MQILVKVETGFNCNWRNIEPLQPDGFKGQTENEKETLKNSIVKNGFHDAFDVWKHDNKLLSIDGVHRKIALLELAAEGLRNTRTTTLHLRNSRKRNRSGNDYFVT